MSRLSNLTDHFDQLILDVFENLVTLIIETVLSLLLKLLQTENHALQLGFAILTLGITQMREIFFQRLLKGINLLALGFDGFLLGCHLLVQICSPGLSFRQLAQGLVQIDKADFHGTRRGHPGKRQQQQPQKPLPHHKHFTGTSEVVTHSELQGLGKITGLFIQRDSQGEAQRSQGADPQEPDTRRGPHFSEAGEVIIGVVID